MEKVIKIFHGIQNASGTNDKKRIILENKDNELFKKCLRFLLDSNIITGISNKKINKHISLFTYHVYCSQDITTFENIMDYLQNHNTGKDEDICVVQSFLSIHEDNREFYEQMITKSLKLGIDAKLVNKCIPGLIPTFDVQLGTSIDGVKLKGNEWISISQKLNGTRCSFVGDKCMTRQGKEYTGLDHIIKDLKALIGTDMFVDGELIYKNKEKLSDSEAFQKGTGIAMSKDADKSELKFVVFDMFPLSEFKNGRSELSYQQREEKYLRKLHKDILKYYIDNIEVVRICYQGFDHSKIWEWLDYAENNDWEGVVVNLDTCYECKRTKNLIKVKKFKSADLLCTGIEEGTGKNKGTLGSIICDYKGYPLNVGSGFSDADRQHFWNIPDDIVGHIVTVKYKEKTKNKEGGLSIQFPIFETVRFDKNEPSYV